jgi:hypothetical protein
MLCGTMITYSIKAKRVFQMLTMFDIFDYREI